MINYSDFFLAIYTNECKSYCDERFLRHLLSTQIFDTNNDTNEIILRIVDNSVDDFYLRRLIGLIKKYNPLTQSAEDIASRIEVSREDKETLFLRNVTESVLKLREMFLQTNCKYFITLESDVLPPADWLHSFIEVINHADVIGGIYYKGFHDPRLFEERDLLKKERHVLSGCTLYKREIIEKFPFRWSYDNLGAFSDAWLSWDVNKYNEEQGKEIYKMMNFSNILCEHLDKPGSWNRGQEGLR